MKKWYIKFNNYFMSHYVNESVLTKQKVKLLFYFIIFTELVVVVHFIIMICFVEGVKLNQLLPSPLLLMVMIYLNYSLLKGKFEIAANFSLIAYSILLTVPVVQHSFFSPLDIYSMDFYFLSIIVVQAALFNRISLLVTVSAFFLIIDILSFYYNYQKLTGPELNYFTRGAISSAFNILAISIFSIILKVISRQAVQRSEEESEKNEKNYIKIKHLLESVSNTSSVLADHSDVLTHSANEFIDESQSQAATIEEISSATEEVVSNMEQVGVVMGGQYENIKNLTLKMNELSSITSDINVQINSVNLSSGEITSMAEQGGRVLQRMLSGMNKVAVSSKEMMNIVSIISNIADRINLLSLNASIEAARAGVTGRGFAVVADEISRLGEETQRNMTEINKLIQTSSQEINDGLQNVEITVNSMTEIIDKISIIVEEINSISIKTSVQQNINKTVNDESESLREKSDQIKIMMEEQQSALNEIAKAIIDINEITQAYVDGSRKLYENAESVDMLAVKMKNEVEMQN